MTTTDAIRLTASVHRTWVGSTEHWAFELPLDGQPGRMRSGQNTKWQCWHQLSAEQTTELIAMCEATLALPDDGSGRPTLAVDGSAMRISLQAPGQAPLVDDCIPLEGWANQVRTAPTSPLLRLVAMIDSYDWPDRAILEDRSPVLSEVVPGEQWTYDATRTLELMPSAWFERSDSSSVLFQLPKSWLARAPQAHSLDGLMFEAKQELHLTLLSSREAEILAAKLHAPAWCEVFEALDWTLSTSGKAALMKETKPAGLEYSLVTPVTCPAVNQFRNRLSGMSGVALADTVPHVTLWVRPSGRGIGIDSVSQYNDCFVRVLDTVEATPFLDGTVFAPRKTETDWL